MLFYLVISDFFLCTCAGNAAVIKPSEVCAHTAKVMEDLLPLYIDKVRMTIFISIFLQ